MSHDDDAQREALQARLQETLALAAAHNREQQHAKSLNHLADALALCRKLNDGASTFGTLLRIGQAHAALSMLDEAEAAFKAAEEIATHYVSASGLAHVAHERAQLALARDDDDAALALMEQAAVWAHRADDPSLEAAIRAERSQRLLDLDRLADASTEASKAANVARDNDLTGIFAVARLGHIRALMRLGLMSEADDLATALVATTAPFGNDIHGYALRFAAQLARVLNQPQRALEHLRALRDLHLASGSPLPTTLLLEFAQIAAQLGDGELEESMERAVQTRLAADTGPGAQSIRLRLAARAAFDKGDLDTAEAGLRQSLALSEQIRHIVGQIEALKGLALVHEQRGDVQGAFDTLTQASKLCAKLPDFQRQCQVMHEVARIHLMRGDHHEAIATLRDTEATQERLGLSHDRARTLHALGISLGRLGLFTEAAEVQRRAAELTPEHDPALTLQAELERACMFRALGQTDHALTAMRDLHARAANADLPDLHAHIGAQLGDTLRTSGRLDDALAVLTQAHDAVDRPDASPHLRGLIAHWLGRTLFERSDASCIAHLTRAQELLQHASPQERALNDEALTRARARFDAPAPPSIH